MKLKSFFFKSIAFSIFLLFIFNISCTTFKYNVGEFNGQDDSNFLNHFYPIPSNDPKNPINETMNFCSLFIDENGIFYSIIIELNKLILNDTEFWFYEAFFFDYSPIQKQNAEPKDPSVKPIIIKITQTSINPLTPLKIKDQTISFGKNIFSWNKNKLIFEIKDKNNYIKITSNLYPKNNFSILGTPLIKQPNGQSAFFTSSDLPTECEYTLYYSEKEKVKKRLKNGFGIIYKSWGTNSASNYELHFLKFANFNLKDIQIRPPQNFLDKSYLFFSIPKAQFYSVLEITKNNNIPVFNLIQNFFPENDYAYSKVIPDKNRRYPSNFSILLNNNLIRFTPFYDKSTVQFFTHDCWFGIVPVYDSAGRIIGLGFSNLYEYSRMK